MSVFRQGLPPHHTALAMIGAKKSGRVLVIGAGDGALVAELALVTGLNGRTVVVDRTGGARSRVEAAAGAAGALVEFDAAPPTMLPFDPGAFDVVVLQRVLSPADAPRTALVAEAARVLRAGGRVIAIEDSRRPGLFGALTRSARPLVDAGVVRDALAAAGLFGARVLADTDGVAYVEATR